MTNRAMDRGVVVRRLRVMTDLLDHLEALGVSSASDLRSMSIRLQVERILTQLVNLAAEINAHAASTLLGSAPEDYRDGFDLAARAGIIPEEVAAALKPSVGLRNVLTHEYVDVDLGIVARAVPQALKGYRSYVTAVADVLRR